MLYWNPVHKKFKTLEQYDNDLLVKFKYKQKKQEVPSASFFQAKLDGVSSGEKSSEEYSIIIEENLEILL